MRPLPALAHAGSCSFTLTQPHPYAGSRSCRLTFIHTHTGSRLFMLTQAHTPSHSHRLMLAHTGSRSFMLTLIHAHMGSRSFMLTQAQLTFPSAFPSYNFCSPFGTAFPSFWSVFSLQPWRWLRCPPLLLVNKFPCISLSTFYNKLKSLIFVCMCVDTSYSVIFQEKGIFYSL